MLLSYTMLDFHLFYDGAVDIQICALLTRSHCKVSDTQVTVKACGPLVSLFNRIQASFLKKDYQSIDTLQLEVLSSRLHVTV